ncbi:hypothetical protein [Cylindrospermopsis raciborskii]|uniref:hypothetical protein n=1 Tax=Cylindrospermopsis raciborskii TaxID=77022 RepID=UPI0021552D37|nr:hypothetical protein [Cylindrospermopsis raciborskii]
MSLVIDTCPLSVEKPYPVTELVDGVEIAVPTTPRRELKQSRYLRQILDTLLTDFPKEIKVGGFGFRVVIAA